MQLVLLEEQAQFDQLKKDDIIIVKWKPGSSEFKKNRVIGHYSMVEINRNNEIILRVRDNVYFIIEMYLEGTSNAAEAYVVQS